jgi:hypothetical protein
MIDYYIKHFYDQVKDPSWPDIKNYTEFLALPDAIKNECNTDFNLPSRLSELEDVNYWKQNQYHVFGYQYKNLVYVPVLKCANTYYTNYFKNVLGWKQVNLSDIDHSKIITFGLIMNPMTRRVKGIVEVLGLSYNGNYSAVLELLRSPGFVKLLGLTIIFDSHTLPYTTTFGDLLNKIHWIPMEPFNDSELKQQITYFLKSNGVDIDIPNDNRINQSSSEKEKVFNTLQDIFLKMEPLAELGMMFAEDIKFYNNLLKNYALLHNNN